MPPRFAFWTIILDGAPTSFRTREREEILPLFNQLKAKNPDALLKWFSGGQLWDSPEQAREARALEKVRRFREERAREKQARAWKPGSPDTASPKAEDPLAEFRRQHGRPADGSDDPSLRRERGVPPHRDARPRRDGQPQRRSDSWTPGASAPASPKAERAVRPGKDWRPGGDHRDPRDKYKLPPGEARKRWKERNLGPGKRRGPTPFGAKPGGPKPGGPRQPFGERPRRPGRFGSKPGGPRRKG